VVHFHLLNRVAAGSGPGMREKMKMDISEK